MSGEPITLSFENIRVGWSDLTLSIGDEVLRIEGFSYCADTFADLARMGVDTLLDAYRTTIHLDSEPCEWRVVLERTWSANEGFVHELKVLFFPDIQQQQPDAEGREHFRVRLNGEALARAIHAELVRIRDEVGIEKFKSEWLLPFPSRALAALEVALETPLRPPPPRGEIVHIVEIR